MRMNLACIDWVCHVTIPLELAFVTVTEFLE